MNTLHHNNTPFKWDNTTLSLFRNHSANEPSYQIRVEDFVAAIQAGTWQSQVAAVRQAVAKFGRDSAEHRAAKGELSAVTLSACCSTKAADVPEEAKLVAYTYLLQIDLDLHDTAAVEEWKQRLGSDPHIVFAAVSPSGDGVKAALAFSLTAAVEEDNEVAVSDVHRLVFAEADRYLISKYGIQNDPPVKNLFRLCYVLYDPNIIYNPAAQPLLCDIKLPRNAEPIVISSSSARPTRTLAETTAETSANSTIAGKLEKIIQIALDKVSSAVVNQRQSTTLSQAKRLGTFVGGGYLDEDDVKQRLLEAVRANPFFKPDDEKERLTAIENGLKYGKKEPAVLLSDEDLQKPLVVEYQCYGETHQHETCLDEIVAYANDLDIGEGRLLKRLFADKIRYQREKKDKNAWVVYANGVWNQTHTEVGITLAMAVRDVINPHLVPIKEEIDPDSREKIDARMTNKKTNEGIANVKRSYIEVINDSITDYDTSHYLFNCANGTYDLREMKLRKHKPEDLLQKQSPAAYVEGAQCPEWLEFLNQIYQGNQDIINFIQIYAGLCLSGEITEHFVYLWGEGSNGKSTMLRVLMEVLGYDDDDKNERQCRSYAQSIKSQALTNDGERGKWEMAKLFRSRMAITTELEEGTKYNSQILKSLASQDAIVGEAKFEDPITFRPTHKLWIQGNHKPKITDRTDGFARRFIFIPHLWKIPKEHQLPTEVINQKFRAEISGILQWMIEGWKRYMELGRRLVVPDCLKDTTDDYLKENIEQPIVVQFLMECDEVRFERDNHSLKAHFKELYEAFGRWQIRYRTRSAPMTKKSFSTAMINDAKLHHGRDNKGTYFAGVGLVADEVVRVVEFPHQPKMKVTSSDKHHKIDMDDITFDDFKRLFEEVL